MLLAQLQVLLRYYKSNVVPSRELESSVQPFQKMPAPPNLVFTIFAFISFSLCLIKLPKQLHGKLVRTSRISLFNTIYSAWSWNIVCVFFLAWVGLESLFLGINSIIWNNNTINWAPVWCDICRFFLFFCFKQYL